MKNSGLGWKGSYYPLGRLLKKEDIVCISARDTKKVRGICWVLAEMQSKGVMDMMVDVVSCSVLRMENLGFF